MDEGDGSVKSLLRQRLGLQRLLGTLLVPQPSGDARREVLLHLQYSSLLLLFSLSRNRTLNLTVRAGTLSEFERGSGLVVGEMGVDWCGERVAPRARSGAG